MMKGTIFIECAVRAKQPFHFKEAVLGFAEFSCHIWQHIIFEFPYIKGCSSQTLENVADTAVKVLKLNYGSQNIKFKMMYNEDLNGEKLPMII